jgi:citrate lyase beta subunit
MFEPSSRLLAPCMSRQRALCSVAVSAFLKRQPRARAEVAAWEAAAAADYGSTRLGDSMVDAPVVRRARQLLAQVDEIHNP